ncbi:hypothetical protein H6F74_10080 [Trichocoleus sp. FACHB-90]|uniref:hypothetical protein n=1 Tax=Cyanophyceae TaxID=3028117 RepID=UPI001683B2FE|nr:hypothetical protein [Trichocoleus sp. FACHB-90]MBD1926589.1 hypothetical protein [Trichocoleus sp. FACHB-90]
MMFLRAPLSSLKEFSVNYQNHRETAYLYQKDQLIRPQSCQFEPVSDLLTHCYLLYIPPFWLRSRSSHILG